VWQAELEDLQKVEQDAADNQANDDAARKVKETLEKAKNQDQQQDQGQEQQQDAEASQSADATSTATAAEATPTAE
jgi:hypothetical protein